MDGWKNKVTRSDNKENWDLSCGRCCCFPLLHIRFKTTFLFQLNPHMLENPGEAVTNAQHLLDILSIVVEDVFASTEKCPAVLRYICRCLQESASAKWPDENVRTRVVSSFIFLRLMCPAIINPRMFNLITGEYSHDFHTDLQVSISL
jgi:hypothetical protein